MVKDKYGNDLFLYDLVAIEEIPVSSLMTAEEEDNEVDREWLNRHTRNCRGRYGMVYYSYDEISDPRWYFADRDELHVKVRYVDIFNGFNSIAEHHIVLSLKCVRRLSINPVLLFPYARFLCPTGVAEGEAAKANGGEYFVNLEPNVRIAMALLNQDLRDLENDSASAWARAMSQLEKSS
jgi:hypothetical protein